MNCHARDSKILIWAFLLSLGSFISPFSLLDVILPENVRKITSGYVFGNHDVTFQEFESVTITAWIGLFFQSDGKFYWKRLLIASFFVPVFTLSISVQIGYLDNVFWAEPGEFWLNSLYALYFITIAAFATIPFDCLNLFVGRYVYFGELSENNFAVKLFADFTLSLAVCGTLTGIIFVVFAALHDPINAFSSTPIIGPIFDALSIFLTFGGVLSLLQFILLLVFVVVVGSTFRFLIIASRTNSWFRNRTGLKDAPFTFLGILSFLAISFIDAVFRTSLLEALGVK